MLLFPGKGKIHFQLAQNEKGSRTKFQIFRLIFYLFVSDIAGPLWSRAPRHLPPLPLPVPGNARVQLNRKLTTCSIFPNIISSGTKKTFYTGLGRIRYVRSSSKQTLQQWMDCECPFLPEKQSRRGVF